ncbi:MAG: Stp1/IreP family PP2C-type Ser/Thr phosphatase [Gemmatimonadaceae bacterium]
MSAPQSTNAPAGEVVVHVFGRTDVGRTREHNEDAFVVADLSTDNATLQPEVRTHVGGPKGSLFMVADGMGGAAAGEIASAMAVEIVVNELRATWIPDTLSSAQGFVRALKAATKAANERIHSYAASHLEYRGMGTTATIAGLLGDTLYLAQVGDSRAYIVREGVARQITKDQSLMQKLIEAGELTEEEAERSERRNIILQALGPEPTVKVDLTQQTIRSGDTLVLCSDGLSGQVTKDDIGTVATEEEDLTAACKRLIDIANGNGGPDNITVIVARFEGPGLRAPGASDNIGHRVFPLPDTGQTPSMAIDRIIENDAPTQRLSAVPRPTPPPIDQMAVTLPNSMRPTVPAVQPNVSPERRNTGRMIAYACLAIMILFAGWFVARQFTAKSDSTSATAPKG